jgi:hypothetical protein
MAPLWIRLLLGPYLAFAHFAHFAPTATGLL